MAIIDMIRKWNEKKSINSERFKEMQEQDRLNTMLEERKKSSNQRELEKHYKREEEARIKEALQRIHKKQDKDNWKGNSILAGGTSILKGGASIMKNDRPILKQKNIFASDKKSKMGLGGCMYFK